MEESLTKKDIEATKLRNKWGVFNGTRDLFIHVFWTCLILLPVLLPLTDFDFSIIPNLFLNISFIFGFLHHLDIIYNQYCYSKIDGWPSLLSKDDSIYIYNNEIYLERSNNFRCSLEARMIFLIIITISDLAFNLSEFFNNSIKLIIYFTVLSIIILSVLMILIIRIYRIVENLNRQRRKFKIRKRNEEFEKQLKEEGSVYGYMSRIIRFG
jgi:hypothetical protein